MLKKCKRLEGVQRERACENWDYLKSIGIQERKLPSIVVKCPKILTLHLDEKLIPMVQCLATLGTKPREVASAITKFPHILSHSVEEKLCPLLAFFQALEVPEKQLGLSELDLQKVAVNFPEVLCRDVNKILRPNYTYLKGCGFEGGQIVALVTGYPPILIKSISNSLEPRIKFLVEEEIGVKAEDFKAKEYTL
ncbi:mitochondrial transcription termination factor family protein [Actinidia rufa]|uniref:Mitochondrial transcription termination factor family protein n=1 Tax=Actinidia rufa TaxID=165716 RepID=A0A7J0DNB5_9ERIC|nr:mitochondrial transcription termination factor family protein [Actinidia rufa]